MYDALRNLVTFVQFKNCEKQPWRCDTFSKVEASIPLKSSKHLRFSVDFRGKTS